MVKYTRRKSKRLMQKKIAIYIKNGRTAICGSTHLGGTNRKTASLRASRVT
jgi:hypothetical protein